MENKEIEKELKKLYPEPPFKKLLEGGMSYAYECGDKIIRIPKNEYAEKGYETEYAILEYLHTTITCTQLPDVKIER